MTTVLAASAIILAGGQSRRMGKPKAALLFGHSTILEGLIAELRNNFDDILVIAAPEQSEPFQVEHLLRAAPSSVRLLRDPVAYRGAAYALAQGLVAAAHEIVFACSCDLPLLQAEVVRALYEMLNGYDAVIPDIDGQPQPLCAVYRRTVAGCIETQLARSEYRLTRITAALRAYRPGDRELQQIDPGLHSFMNINTPEDYHRALASRQSRERGKSR
jgi:molybdopterin-guanine dinucleotide biosynthesis protein A